MAIFPKVQSPCPYKSRLAEVMDGDMCRMCDRQVFDLSDMTDAERVAFMSGCTEQVCVSYRFPIGPVLAAAVAAAALAAPMSAAAQDATEELIELVVGGIIQPGKAEYISDEPDPASPELPVIYDDADRDAPDANVADAPAPAAETGS